MRRSLLQCRQALPNLTARVISLKSMTNRGPLGGSPHGALFRADQTAVGSGNEIGMGRPQDPLIACSTINNSVASSLTARRTRFKN